MHPLDALRARGFIENHTPEDSLRQALSTPGLAFYIGFDPTGDSLHVGHLVQVMVMRRLQQHGLKPVLVQGGGTAMVGDPSGKSEARQLITPEIIAHNLACQKVQFARYLDLDEVIWVDNSEWLCSLKYVDFLRDIGRHFSVNRMIAAESAKQRLERNQGLSFLEFNYHLLQSYDYLVLHDRYDVQLQVGGNDQWFNILGGVDLIRRMRQQSVHAMTTPLLTTADGKKMGKTEKGAVYLDPERTSPYDLYQYWINVDDRDVGRFLRLYTDLPLDRLDELEALKGSEIRQAKRVLAEEATSLAHGREAARKAAEAAKALFSGGSSNDVPTHDAPLPAPLVNLMADSGLVKSRGEARRLIKQGGCRLGADRATKVTDPELIIESETVVWAGKKKAMRIRPG